MDTPGFKTILCPVDFGELSAQALQMAQLLAGCGNAKVIAMYANWFDPRPISRRDECKSWKSSTGMHLVTQNAASKPSSPRLSARIQAMWRPASSRLCRLMP